MAKQRLYYAHAMCTYGWAAERPELVITRRKFRRARIVNPAAYRDHPDKRRDQIGFCLRLVAASHSVVFSRIMGKVTAGVGKEVNHALRLGKPVYEIVAAKVVRRKRRVSYISPRASRTLYEKWRLQQYRQTWAQ